MDILLVLGNQLFDPALWPEQLKSNKAVFMREDRELCTYYKFHKHKIIFFLAAMRTYKDELIKHGSTIHYESMNNDKLSYDESLLQFIKAKKCKKIYFFEIEDKFFEARILKIIEQANIEHEVLRSPMFLTSRASFKEYLGNYKKPFMKNFYERQRKQFKILVDKDSKPVGGQWSFDEENRLALPSKIIPPSLPALKTTAHISAVQKICEQ
ncbi:MAG: cryptochrome/photolyase family protein, partial [Bdellovibrionaceae bacterium]|nr:cryptochrome/photolyase family protein [Pseudobdellovibrionaceae bacterium]